MTNLKKRLLALYDVHLSRKTPRLEVVDTSAEGKAETSTDNIGLARAAGLEVYSATTAELNRWHAAGDNVFLQTLLREYELDDASPNVAAFNHFKIGMDCRRHVATFALSDTRYVVIQFDEHNTQVSNRVVARRVLATISQIRQSTSRIKDFCGFELETFDDD